MSGPKRRTTMPSSTRHGSLLGAPGRPFGPSRVRQSWRRGAAAAFILVALFAPQPVRALEKVSLQLKWLHQFQFAGYYVALEKNFYRDEGLDVEIRPGGPGIDAMADVAAGKADFGVCATGVLLQKPGQQRVVVLGVIFQQSAAQILVPSRARINAVSELAGRRLMDASGSDDLAAMLKHEGVNYAALPRVEHSGDPLDLVRGKADAMVSYITNEPFVLEQHSIPYRSFRPRAFGFDFYGDNLCTGEDRARRHPGTVEAFLRASLRGWEYALSNKQEAVDIILRGYQVIKSREALLFEAVRTETLIQPGLIAMGSQNAERWNAIARVYQDLGMLPKGHLPEPPIYLPLKQRIWLWLRVAAITTFLLGTGVIAFVIFRKYRGGIAGKPRLSVVMSVLFVSFSIPILIFILAYNHQKNSEAVLALLQSQIAKSRSASISNIESLLHGIEGILGLLAESAATQPSFFRTEESLDSLYRVLTSSSQIDAAYVSFEDGYHRVVTRMDDDRKRSDPQIPARANWHSSYLDPISDGAARRRYRTFYDTWPTVIGRSTSPTSLDVRTLPGYAAAKESRSLYITEPALNPDTGYPIISARYPIYRGDNEFLGCASVNITFDVLSRYLAAERPSVNSTTIIADASDGSIIASSDRDKSGRAVAGSLQIASLASIDDADVRAAYRRHIESHEDDFVFVSPVDGRELSASFALFSQSFGAPWLSVILTPTDDFVGSLRATNRKIVLTIIALTAIELVLIFGVARRLTRPIERVTQELEAIESFSFEKGTPPTSQIKEVSQLQAATQVLRSSLQSFSSFAPVEVLKGLVKSGIPLSLGVQERELTIFFSDIENFSTHAERSDPDALLKQLSEYFEVVSKALTDEGGTIDKFIGDGVMAFWGAPTSQAEAVLLACRGAMRCVRRLEARNGGWIASGRPAFRTRIGLNLASVLVGNVGSPDRFSYTAIGDGVNVASRLEGMNKQFGTAICVSDSVVRAAGSRILARPLRRVAVKGREQHFMIYELLGIAGSDDPELRPMSDAIELCELTQAASTLFEAGKLKEAANAYRAILARWPDDVVSKAMLDSPELSTQRESPQKAVG